VEHRVADFAQHVDAAQMVDQADGLAMPRAAVLQEPQAQPGPQRRRPADAGDIALIVLALDREARLEQMRPAVIGP
jgi:hypothetical protein